VHIERQSLKSTKKSNFLGRAKRAGKPKIDGEVEANLIALVCSDPPDGQVRWTLRLLADKLCGGLLKY